MNLNPWFKVHDSTFQLQAIFIDWILPFFNRIKLCESIYSDQNFIKYNIKLQKLKILRKNIKKIVHKFNFSSLYFYTRFCFLLLWTVFSITFEFKFEAKFTKQVKIKCEFCLELCRIFVVTKPKFAYKKMTLNHYQKIMFFAVVMNCLSIFISTLT